MYALIKKEPKFSVVLLRLTSEMRGTYINLIQVEKEYVNENSSDEEDNNEQDIRLRFVNFHYVWVKDLSSLVSGQLSKHGEKKHL